MKNTISRMNSPHPHNNIKGYIVQHIDGRSRTFYGIKWKFPAVRKDSTGIQL